VYKKKDIKMSKTKLFQLGIAFILCVFSLYPFYLLVQQHKSNTFPQTPQTPIEQLDLPFGSTIIASYGKHPIDRYDWVKWELQGECFLSKNVTNHAVVIVKVNCQGDKK
jgi:hypothetical protein